MLAHQLDAFVRVIDGHRVAHALEDFGNGRGEFRLACRPVAVSQYEIGARTAGIVRNHVADSGHRVAVDVPRRTEGTMHPIDRCCNRGVIRLVAIGDAPFHLCRR